MSHTPPQTDKKTGFWLEELAAPYWAFKDAKYEGACASCVRSASKAQRRAVLRTAQRRCTCAAVRALHGPCACDATQLSSCAHAPLPEAYLFSHALRAVTLASPKGGKPPLDPASDNPEKVCGKKPVPDSR